MEQDNFSSSNIHLDWLDNIMNQLKDLQDIERLSREGCRSIIEYVSIPPEIAHNFIVETCYKNIQFFIMELHIVVTNLQSTLKEDSKEYFKRLEFLDKKIKNKKLFVVQKFINNELTLELTEIYYKTLDLLIVTKRNLIKDISSLLFIKGDDKPTW